MNLYLIVSVLVTLLLIGGMIYLLLNRSATDQKLVKLDATTATVTQISDTINTLQKNLSDSDGKYDVLIKTTLPGIKTNLQTLLNGVDEKVNSRVTSLSGTVKGLPEAVKVLQELTATLSSQDSVDKVKDTLFKIQTQLNVFLEKDYINTLNRIIALEAKDKTVELKFPEIEKALNRIRMELDMNTQKDAIYQDYVNKINKYVDNASNSDRIPNNIKQRIFSSSNDYVKELLALPDNEQMINYVINKLSGRYPCLLGKRRPSDKAPIINIIHAIFMDFTSLFVSKT